MKDLKKPAKPIQTCIVQFLRPRIADSDNPRAIGEPLRGAMLGSCWKYRVGDARIVGRVLRVGNRREWYR